MSEQLVIPEVQALTNFDEELAKIASATASQEQVGGQFFSIAGGRLAFGGAAVPNNSMVVIVLDGIHENIFYKDRYDPEAIGGPTCFALGRIEADMAPHPLVVAAGTAQNKTCLGCPKNEWGSSDVGKGKACKNVRRLSLLGASIVGRDGTVTVIEDSDHYAAVVPGYLRVPVTSVKNYSAFVKQLDSLMKLPTFAVYTRITVEPDPKTQVRVIFEPMKPVPKELLPTLMNRWRESQEGIMFANQPAVVGEEVEAAKPKFRGRRKF